MRIPVIYSGIQIQLTVLFYFFVCANRVNTASIDQYDRVEFLCFKFTVDQVRTHLLPVLFFSAFIDDGKQPLCIDP